MNLNQIVLSYFLCYHKHDIDSHYFEILIPQCDFIQSPLHLIQSSFLLHL
jgi:hypothetical protein